MVYENNTPPAGSNEDLIQDNDQGSCNESADSAESPQLSRSSSVSSSSQLIDDWDFTPLDKLTVFDVLDNLALPLRLEKINKTLNLKKHRDKVKEQYVKQKERVIRKRDEELEKLKGKYTKGLDELIVRWNDTAAISAREKISFVVGVSNIFITGFLAGGYPEWMHVWYSLQLIYFMPLRYYTYHKKGYHYFLADLCYFVNVLLVLSIWVFPNSRRLFISTYCLSYGNNAWAIAMWRNSLVFHSLDKVTSLFIHIMPPLVLHCLVHQLDSAYLESRFPAISRVKGIEQYGLGDMILYATVPYATWQISYHFFITVRRAPQIKAGRPTSFTWLRKSYAKTWIGKLVLKLPENLQEFAFMFIQYIYALLTMLPCAFWFYNKKMSSIFISCLGLWSVYNGATYYIDVFGNRFQKELEQLKKDVAKWQNSPEAHPSPIPGGTATEDIPLAKVSSEFAGDEQQSTTKTVSTTTGRETVHTAPKREDGGEIRERNVTTVTTTMPA
ncbi:hypothetical protein BDZ91DRAFT_649388 [Kalaharituber pfeilii]|nr:hypothetical protein BDZ91DRAFT_649388 [Kalaharituber pfeilii]